jgi:Formylmethanofuran dehydrogenase subunit A
MAGGIDIHSHIAGANVNTARLLMPAYHHAAQQRPDVTPLANAGWTTFATGCLYARMGFTMVVEPAVARSTLYMRTSSSPTSRSSTRQRCRFSATTIFCSAYCVRARAPLR